MTDDFAPQQPALRTQLVKKKKKWKRKKKTNRRENADELRI